MAEKMHEETAPNGVTFELWIEPESDVDVQGSFSTGDEAADKATEDEILEAIEAGNPWAWFNATCIAKFEQFAGEDSLGACAMYKGVEDFCQSGGYWPDMKAEAESRLADQLKAAYKAYAKYLAMSRNL